MPGAVLRATLTYGDGQVPHVVRPRTLVALCDAVGVRRSASPSSGQVAYLRPAERPSMSRPLAAVRCPLGNYANSFSPCEPERERLPENVGLERVRKYTECATMVVGWRYPGTCQGEECRVRA